MRWLLLCLVAVVNLATGIVTGMWFSFLVAGFALGTLQAMAWTEYYQRKTWSR